MRRPLESLALRLVPEHWRQDVGRDLDDERGPHHGTAWFVLRATEIGARLRLEQAAETLRHATDRSWRPPMLDFTRDLTFAIRSGLRQPASTLAIVATLAIGIGANTAIFSVFNWILFRPIPGVARPGELVTVRFQTPKSEGRYFVPYLDYAELRDRMTSLSGLAGSVPITVHLAERAGDDGSRRESEIVSVNYFTVLGAEPVRGRGFVAAEEQTLVGLPPVVISHALWSGQFRRDPAVLGRTLGIDGHDFVIVGVAPEGFAGRSLVSKTDLWMPVGAHMALLPHYGPQTLTARQNTFFGDAIGRLRDGITLATAQAEARAVADASEEFATRGPKRQKSSIRPVLYQGIGHDTFARDRIATMFNLLMGAVGLVLLLACANAANLLLARTTARRREIAVRQAIGAGRTRIIRQQLAEGLVFSLAAGLAGIAIAVLLTSAFDGMRILPFLPELDGVRIDLRVAAFALGVSLLTTVAFATIPAIAGTRIDLLPALKDGQTVSRSGRPLLRGGLVLVQITVSLVLVVAAGLFIRTLHNLRAVDLGIELDDLASLMADPSRLGHSPERSQQMLREISTRLAQVPGITSAAIVWAPPFTNRRAEMAFTRPADPTSSHDAASTAISPGYFATMGITIVEGRDFAEAEYGRLNTASGVVILSQGLARRIFPSGGAVGSRLRLSYPEKMEVEVVGVVGDVRGRPAVDAEPFAYEPIGQRWATSWANIVVRSSLPSAQLSSTARDVLRSVDPRFTPPLVEPFPTLLERSLSEQRLIARLSMVFAGVAVLLAGMGIYAMMTGAVAERRREFGIRLALGATAGRLHRQVLRGAVVLGSAGACIGLAAAVAARRLIEARLFGISPIDPGTLGSAAAAVVLLCTVASLIPALKAGRVDPVKSLRVE